MVQHGEGASSIKMGEHACSELLRLRTFLGNLMMLSPGEEVVDTVIKIVGANQREQQERELTQRGLHNLMVSPPPSPTNRGYVEQLMQLFATTTWDGDLVCKEHRDRLAHEGLVGRSRGWNFITAKGVEALVQLGLVRIGDGNNPPH